MAKNDGACTFGLVLEQKVGQLEKSTTEIKDMIKDMKKSLGGRMTELFNHQSTYVSPAVVSEIKTQWKVITILCGLLTFFGGIVAAFGIALLTS